jgi:hypothetical protein
VSSSVIDRTSMTARCEVCGFATRSGIRIIAGGVTHLFDSYQCAIHRLAPECEHCGCRILGRPLEVQQRPYCSPECLAAVQHPVARVYPIHLRET